MYESQYYSDFRFSVEFSAPVETLQPARLYRVCRLRNQLIQAVFVRIPISDGNYL
ncbi:hypothetical protein SAMD00079811_43080 [Scytonema sp. HK-05]|nr:hypothetical protein SAMD00079811_43080 [Scytonema sp. HK-05]